MCIRDSAYIDRKKKLPVTTLLRAIGFENDKDILEIFNLAEDVKVNKTNRKRVLGRKATSSRYGLTGTAMVSLTMQESLWATCRAALSP